MSRHDIYKKDMNEQIREYNTPVDAKHDSVTYAADLKNDLRIIRDMSELYHTCYIELCPESARTRVCWNKGAVYFTIDGFEYLEPFISEVYEYYSPYSFQHLSREEWCAVIDKMRVFSDRLKEASDADDLKEYLGVPRYKRLYSPFTYMFDFMCEHLSAYFDEVIAYLEAELEENERIHILGL